MMEEEKAQKGEDNSAGFVVLLAILAGSLFGCGAALIKIATGATQTFNPLSTGDWNILLTNLAFWAMILTNGTGIGAWLLALQEGRVTIVGPVVGGFIVFVPVIFGLTYFNEPMTLIKGLGILTISIGSMGLARKG